MDREIKGGIHFLATVSIMGYFLCFVLFGLFVFVCFWCFFQEHMVNMRAGTQYVKRTSQRINKTLAKKRNMTGRDLFLLVKIMSQGRSCEQVLKE